MKKNAIVGSCIILFVCAFIGLQIHWRLLARSTEENPYTLLDAIRKGNIGILNGNIVYIGDAAYPTDVHVLTEQQFNTEFTKEERRAYEQGYEQAQNLRAGVFLLPSKAALQNNAQEVINDKFQAMVEEPLSGIKQPESLPMPPPLPSRPLPQQQVIIEDEENVVTNAQPDALLEQIREGVQLRPVQQQEKQKTLHDEIKEGVTLRPASARELPERKEELTIQDEIKQGKQLKPVEERELAPRPEKPLTVLDEIRQFDKDTLKSIDETPESETGFVNPEQEYLQQSLQDRFQHAREEDGEEDRMTPEEMGAIPSASLTDEMIQPERRPASNQALLEEIRAGKELKKVPQALAPMTGAQESAQKHLEKNILQYKQVAPETDESEYEENDWD